MGEMTDVVVVGGGIVGLAHAVLAARRGQCVCLVEREKSPIGASIRNFGMIWPIGQPAGDGRRRALRGREIWREMAREAGFWCRESGSIHAAYADDEWAVLREFVAGSGVELGVELLAPAAARGRCPALREEGLRGGLWSANELAVDPREAVAALLPWLAKQPKCRVIVGDPVVRAGGGEALTAGGERLTARRIFVCTGADTAALFPEVYARQPVVKCKLQMMRTAPQPGGWRLGPHVAFGLTLRHYAAFAGCPSLPALRARIARETPELDRFGIHVLAAQNGLGELVLGDSHEYGEAIPVADNREIDRLILDYLRRVLTAPDLEPAARWNGVYLKRTDGEAALIFEPEPGVRIVNALGGAGMTLAFGLAEEQLDA